MATVKVGMPCRIRGKDYLCVRITKREETYITTVNAFTLRQAHKMNPSIKGGSVVYMRFECEDFNIDDIITESIEEIRFSCIDDSNPFTVVNYKLYKKEKDNDEPGTETSDSEKAEPDQSEADRQGNESEGGVWEESLDKDCDTLHGA